MYNCLAADTIVHTADGDFQIQELVGKEGRLQTYDEVSKIFRCAPFRIGAASAVKCRII